MLELLHMEKTLIFLDTETTGNGPEDRLCQISYKIGDKIVDELYDPGLPIKIEAMAVHHITEKMIKGKPSFKDSPEYKELETLFSNGAIFVAHNAKFDAGMVEKEGLKPKQIIDTYRVARHLDPDYKIQSYGLQYLRYLLGIEVEAVAHDAKGDVLVLEKLFERLLKKIMETENLSEDTAIEQMIDLSQKPIIIRYFKFGKYKNESIEDILSKDRGYLEWLLKEKKLANDDNDEDFIFTLEHYLSL